VEETLVGPGRFSKRSDGINCKDVPIGMEFNITRVLEVVLSTINNF